MAERERVPQNPDLLADHREFFIGDMSDAQRDDLAAELGESRAYVDALIEKMSRAWDALDDAAD